METVAMYGSKYRTIEDAAQAWIDGFNAIPHSLVVKAYPDLMESGLDILATELECGYCGSTDVERIPDSDEYHCRSCDHDDTPSERYDLPMWGTMWTFGERIDEDWARENVETLRECGFWVYESDELGVLIGINGAGYDFYENHWVPLYRARGLRWHEGA